MGCNRLSAFEDAKQPCIEGKADGGVEGGRARNGAGVRCPVALRERRSPHLSQPHETQGEQQAGIRLGNRRKPASREPDVLAGVELVPDRLRAALHVVEVDLTRVCVLREVPEGDAVQHHVAEAEVRVVVVLV